MDLYLDSFIFFLQWKKLTKNVEREALQQETSSLWGSIIQLFSSGNGAGHRFEDQKAALAHNLNARTMYRTSIRQINASHRSHNGKSNRLPLPLGVVYLQRRPPYRPTLQSFAAAAYRLRCICIDITSTSCFREHTPPSFVESIAFNVVPFLFSALAGRPPIATPDTQTPLFPPPLQNPRVRTQPRQNSPLSYRSTGPGDYIARNLPQSLEAAAGDPRKSNAVDLAYSADASMIAVATEDKHVWVWRTGRAGPGTVGEACEGGVGLGSLLGCREVPKKPTSVLFAPAATRGDDAEQKSRDEV